MKQAPVKKDLDNWYSLESAVEESILKRHGPRCKSFYLSCECCMAWMCFDFIFENDRQWMSKKHFEKNLLKKGSSKQ